MSSSTRKRRRVNNSAKSPNSRRASDPVKINQPNANSFLVPGLPVRPGVNLADIIARPYPIHAPEYFGNKGRAASSKHGFNNLQEANWKHKGYKIVLHNDIKEGDKFLYVERDGRIIEVEVIRIDYLPDFPRYAYERKLFYIVKSRGDIFAIFNYMRGREWSFYEKI